VANALVADESATELTAYDQAILEQVEAKLNQGIALKSWWEEKQATNGYAKRFPVVREFNPSSSSFGFYDVAELPGLELPVNGIVDEMLYDNRKGTEAARLREEFREFVLHYFLRVSDFRQPAAHIERHLYAPPDYLHNFSWCPKPRSDLAGFGFSQHYYKLLDTGTIGKFPAHKAYHVADLRDIGAIYEWVVLKIRIFDFDLTFDLPGRLGAKLEAPLQRN